MYFQKYFVFAIVILACFLVETAVGKSHRRLKRRNQDEKKDDSQDLSVLDSSKAREAIKDEQIIPLALTSANVTEATDLTSTKKGKKAHRQHRRNHKKRKQHLKRNRKNKNRDHENEEHDLAIAGVIASDPSQQTMDSSNKRVRGHHHKTSKHHQRQQRRLHRRLQVQQARKLLNEENSKDRDTSADP